ncbi:hypothetical protein WMF01_47735 [Sorangium sp. So ce1667]
MVSTKSCKAVSTAKNKSRKSDAGRAEAKAPRSKRGVPGELTTGPRKPQGSGRPARPTERGAGRS